NYAWAYANRGDAWRKKSEYDKALADCTEAVLLDPQFAWAYNIRGLIHAEKGDLDRAIADHTESIRLDPTYAWAYACRGDAWRRRGDLEEAIADYTESVRLDPQYAWAFKSRGMARAQNKDRDAATRDFHEALRLAPQDPALCNEIAWFLATCPEADVRNGELAVQFAATAVELRRDADSLDTLAAAYAENGEFDKAVDTETQALEEAAKADASFDPTEYRDRLKLYQQNMPYRQKNVP
ncbi:MAG: tetratricopeptide repeat protein, partial [Planctomycetes bacterium]|nr:tetratricopeptide repeat protein [Planctomycetota bacterium]